MADQTNKNKIKIFVDGETIGTREFIQSLKTSKSTRSQVFQIIKTMLRDPTVNSILRGIKEDFTQAFEDGRVIKSVSKDPVVQNAWDQALINFGVAEQIGDQMMTIMSYGEIYGQMFTVNGLRRKLTFIDPREENKGDKLKTTKVLDGENKINANDKMLIQKLHTVTNPLEFYDVRYLSETLYYYRKKIADATMPFDDLYNSDLFKYSEDILVHKILYPAIIKEHVSTDMVDGDGESVEFTIERGVGLLETAYPAYVNLMLAKAAMLMARDARSVVITLIKMQREGMTDEEAEQTVDAILEKVTVRRSLEKEEGVGEYTNSVSAPAVVMVTKDGETGDVSAEQIGGDYDPGTLNDIGNLEDDFYGAFRTVKQKFGKTGDAAGFSGGESLQLLLDSYAQMGGAIQQSLCEFWEEVINRYFESRGLQKFVQQASLVMKKMPTSAETEKENLRDTSIRMASQVMMDIEEKSSQQLKVYRTMLNRTDLNNDIIELIDQIIEEKETEEKAQAVKTPPEKQQTENETETETETEESTLPPMGGIIDELAESEMNESEESEVGEEGEGAASATLPDMLKVVEMYDKARASIKRQRKIKGV